MKNVIGIGSALVDILTRIDNDDILKELDIRKGSMHLVDEKSTAIIEKRLENYESSMAPGGSAANTIHALSKMGIESGFISFIGKDEIGKFFENSMSSVGVKSYLFHTDTASGTARTIISADGERTFATNLGASLELNERVITSDIFKQWDYCYVEGYLIANKPVFVKTISTAKACGCKVVLDLASFNVVEENRDFLNELLPQIDIIFANEEEAKALTLMSAEESLHYIAEKVEIAVVKVGKNGSLIKRGNEVVQIGCNKIDVVDTTGAGDMYAAGFLYGLINDYDLESCGIIGNHLAESIIQVIGAKMDEERWEMFKKNLRN
ncbi:MAG: adenosine kinase [Lentimicrobiaceae bacterium]|nr:adenosine kinase [Lentimicrobiaceae bacterium]